MRLRVLTLAACGAAALGLFLPAGTPGTLASADGDTGEATTPRIQIEHDLVRIPVTPVNTVMPEAEPAERFERRGARADHPRRMAEPVPVSGDGAPARGIVQRAVRTIVGDGRYKPQPFPTPPR